MVDRREDLERPDIEGLWLEVSLPKSRSLLTSCLYRPPNSSNHYDKGFCSKMNNSLNTAVSKGQEWFYLEIGTPTLHQNAQLSQNVTNLNLYLKRCSLLKSSRSLQESPRNLEL